MITVFSLRLDTCIKNYHFAGKFLLLDFFFNNFNFFVYEEYCIEDICMVVFGVVKFIVGVILIVGTLKEIRSLLITFLTLVGIGLILDIISFFEISRVGGGIFALDIILFLISIYGFIVVYTFQCELEDREE